MNKKCVATIDAILDTFGELTEGLECLRQAIEEDNESEIDEALDMFPKPRQFAKDLEKLGKLMEDRPWEKVEKVEKGKKA